MISSQSKGVVLSMWIYFLDGKPANLDLHHFQVFIMSGADPGFLERGFIYIKVWGFALLILSHSS